MVGIEPTTSRSQAERASTALHPVDLLQPDGGPGLGSAPARPTAERRVGVAAKSGWWGSNPRPLAPQTSALPLRYSPIINTQRICIDMHSGVSPRRGGRRGRPRQVAASSRRRKPPPGWTSCGGSPSVNARVASAENPHHRHECAEGRSRSGNAHRSSQLHSTDHLHAPHHRGRRSKVARSVGGREGHCQNSS